METTERGNEHPRVATNQEIEGAEAESMEAVSDPGLLVDVKDSELVCRASSIISEHGEEENCVSEAEMKSEESEHQEIKTDDTVGFENEDAEGMSDPGKELVVVKTEEDFEVKEESVAVQENGSDVNMDHTYDAKEDLTSSNKKVPRVSTANNLDEMMDIGTVDQVEQEAQMKEEQNSQMDVESRCSPSSSNTETNSPSPATMNGMKLVKLSIPRLNIEQLDESVKSPPSPPLVKVKDEPIDEEYDQALTKPTCTASVKDEPSTTKRDLKIGSVFSVPQAPETQGLPVVQPSSVQMSCSHCNKMLMKGQTAFQRKGSPALFCSTACLTTSLPNSRGGTKVCYNCQKLIFRPQDVILAPDTKGSMKEFCSQTCLTSFNYKKNMRKHTNPKKTQDTAEATAMCSMCTRFSVSKHEVILAGSVHKICSDACFNRFRTVNKLSMSGCANCGSFCLNKPLLLKLDNSNKTMCNSECLAKYKEKTKMNQTCSMCQTSRPMPNMVDNKNNDDSVNLFCSTSCVMAYKVQTVSASGAHMTCDSCGKNTVPAYHLAMSDTSIRNFCTLPCVMAFQEKFKKASKQVSVFTKLPIGSAQIQNDTPAQPQQDPSQMPQKLRCSQCSSCILSTPEVIQIKDKLVFVCGADCALEFKKANFVMSVCEYCQIEKITGDAQRIDNKDCFFCSDGCKLLFKLDLAKLWGSHCRSCVYCNCVSKKLVTAQYGGSTEEFCSEDCRSKYTMLFCHVAKCDTCGCKGKLKKSLSMLGEVKHFCDLHCLLQFCCEKVATQGEVIKESWEPTPIIANVISLATSQTGKFNASDRAAQQSMVSNSQSQKSGHISTQTDTVELSTALPRAAPAKILKNKALMCRPLVQDKEVSCKTQTADVEAQTDDIFPKIMVVPVPVPVFVPVPMNMYSQCTPKPVGLPIPLPVPMFLPVTMDSAERIVETIQEIKERIPADPFEAELILMAEMVAEEDKKENKEEKPKEKSVEKESERQEAPPADDNNSNYSEDMDTDDLASFLNNWEDASFDAGLRSPGPPSSEKLNPTLDQPVGMSCSETPCPGSPPMDIEADFTVESLEMGARLREQAQRSPSPPAAATSRRQAHRKAREKRGRKSKVAKSTEAAAQKASSNKAATPEVPKLKSQYGVDAWKRWIQWRQTLPNLEKPRFGSRPVELKEDILKCTTAELSYGLCCFITEVKRPNGEPYSHDSLFYLCLGIQQYLFENGRVENIFMDRFYNKFSTEFTNMLRDFKPLITPSGYTHSRVEEEFLWDCKQLGAYSPIVLLNTLLFFVCKYFGFTTVEQHHQLSFAHVMRCTKTNPNNTKSTFLRFYPPISINESETESEVPAKKRKEEDNKEDILEMMENIENPLRCPVRLYEFYLSKCSESVKQRTNLFYLHPERCCVPNSPLWFSSTPLDDSTMEAMLTRILTVRELHLTGEKEGKRGHQTPPDPPFIPDDEDEGDSD